MKLKRPFFCLCAAFILCLSLLPALPAEAANAYVYDQAGILSATERSDLEARAAEVSGEYGCGVYIVTVPDYRAYDDSAYRVTALRLAAEKIYDDNGFGAGADRSGVMLLLSMSGRDYDIAAYGYGNTAFTDYGKERLAEKFKDNFKRDDWYGGLKDYVGYSGRMLERARNGDPLDRGSDFFYVLLSVFREGLGLGVPGQILVFAGIPLLIAWRVCRRGKKRLKSVARAENAEFFAVPNSLDVRFAADDFTHTTETRVRIEDDSDRGGGGGGGGTSVGSSGFSHSSGKF